jgi:hypothetical protein
LLTFGSFGSGDGQFDSPFGVAISRFGDIVVSDFSEDRIQVFDRAGEFRTSFGSLGSGEGQFRGPQGVAIARSGEIVVIDRFNHRIQVFVPVDADGDICPEVASATGSSGLGDACDPDIDGDGVIDSADACVPTAPGVVVDGDGCSIADLCPCEGGWRYQRASARSRPRKISPGRA